MENVSTKIPFEGLRNTRDLGGMATKDGRRIRKGMLFRSGLLAHATEKDLVQLSGLGLRRIYDFRDTRERTETPDPEIPGAVNLHLPVLPETAPGVTRGEEAEAGAAKMFLGFIEEPRRALDMMAENYKKFVEHPQCRRQYGTFLRDILEQASEAAEKGEQAAFLWHCFGGKDRAGFGSMILEEILGVDRESIIADYMLTNRFTGDATDLMAEQYRDRLVDYFGDKADALFANFREAMSCMTESKMEYIQTSYESIEKAYGDFDTFCTEGLGLGAEDRDRFRALFLEEIG